MTREKYGQQRREEQSKGEERRGEKKERRGEASRQEKSRAEHRRGHASTREESTVQQRRERHKEESGRLRAVPSATFATTSARAGVSRIRRRPPAAAKRRLETLSNTRANVGSRASAAALGTARAEPQSGKGGCQTPRYPARPALSRREAVMVAHHRRARASHRTPLRTVFKYRIQVRPRGP
jgi:hypothetical protein